MAAEPRVLAAVSARRSALAPTNLAALISVPLAAAYLATQPPAADLAAATYRSDLFSRVGLTLYDDGWYAGHHLLGYSLLAPALGALLTPRLLLALSAVVAAVLFAALAEAAFGRNPARPAAAWFAVAISVELLSGRVPFDLGLAIALGALLAAVRRHAVTALALAALSALASPVAGAFLALAAAAGLICNRRPRLMLGLVVASLLPVLLLILAFPEGGYEPFAASAFWPALAGTLLVGALLLQRNQPVLATGAALYALALALAYAVHTPLGGNVARLGALLAGPLAIGALWPQTRRPGQGIGRPPRVIRTAHGTRRARRQLTRLALGATTLALAYWTVITPIRDETKVAGDPSVNASYYAPLLAELTRLTGGHPTRVEVPMLGSHSEADYVAARFSLARGWERQLDTRYASLFYARTTTAAQYRRWLADNAVAYVALPDARLDPAARNEAALITHGLVYLRPLWRSTHWRLFAVSAPTPLITPPATLTALTSDAFSLRAPGRGAYTVRVRFTPYWALGAGHGCVSRAPGGWTRVTATTAGALHVGIDFALDRVFSHGPRCR